MAKLYITEYGSTGPGPLAPQEPALVDQAPVAIGVSSVQSAAFGGGTYLVRIATDAICSVAFGPNPTATANNSRMAAGTERILQVRPGDKLAVITNT